MATARKRSAVRKSSRKSAKAPSRKPAARGKRAARRAPGAIRGVHAMFYCSAADELRAFLRDKLGFAGTDVGGGWLIFEAPEADIGVHPTDGNPRSGTADISFYCEDIAATMKALAARGVEFTGPAQDRGFGFVTQIRVPGGFEVQLYQPKYKK